MSAAEKNGFARFTKRFPKGTVLFNEGDEGEDMFIIRSGQVAIRKRVPHGDIVVAVLEKGDFFGEMSLLEGLPRDASAQAVGGAEVLVMTPGALLVRLRRDPTFAFELLRRLSGRVRTLNARLIAAMAAHEELRPGNAEALLYLTEQAVPAGSP